MSSEQMERELAKEKAKSYALGYQAGQRRKAKVAKQEKRYREERAFWDRVFLSVSEHFAGCNAWTRGDKKLDGLEDRVDLAAKWANEALKHRRKLA